MMMTDIDVADLLEESRMPMCLQEHCVVIHFNVRERRTPERNDRSALFVPE